MARKPTPKAPTSDPELQVPRDEVAKKIGERIVVGQELYDRNLRTTQDFESSKEDFSRWNSYNGEMLNRLFSTPKFAEEYSSSGRVMVISWAGKSREEMLRDHKTAIWKKIHCLESICDRLELIPLASGVPVATRAGSNRERTNKVFVVHGHDDAARESVARFLERLGLEAVILHEQASGGRTIIEKLEHYSDVDFALVLLTPDDVGGVKTATPQNLRPRARQNVVMELGLFLGKLGRAHVCALHKGDVELPTDYLGVVYVPLDQGGGWRLHVAKELKNSGFNVDMNLA